MAKLRRFAGKPARPSDQSFTCLSLHHRGLPPRRSPQKTLRADIKLGSADLRTKQLYVWQCLFLTQAALPRSAHRAAPVAPRPPRSACRAAPAARRPKLTLHKNPVEKDLYEVDRRYLLVYTDLCQSESALAKASQAVCGNVSRSRPAPCVRGYVLLFWEMFGNILKKIAKNSKNTRLHSRSAREARTFDV